MQESAGNSITPSEVSGVFSRRLQDLSPSYVFIQSILKPHFQHDNYWGQNVHHRPAARSAPHRQLAGIQLFNVTNGWDADGSQAPHLPCQINPCSRRIGNCFPLHATHLKRRCVCVSYCWRTSLASTKKTGRWTYTLQFASTIEKLADPFSWYNKPSGLCWWSRCPFSRWMFAIVWREFMAHSSITDKTCCKNTTSLHWKMQSVFPHTF